MRILNLIIFAVTVSFCTPFSRTIAQSYTINRIDSIENFYVIYATRNDSTFQIASKKAKVLNCDQLKINAKYSLKLKSRVFTGKANGAKITSATNDLVKCIGLDRVTVVCFDDNCVQDLFYTENIEGLCYRP